MPELKPLALMEERTQRNGEESDIVLVMELLYLGELVVKLTTSFFVAALEETKEQNQYRLIHTLVRADGIGQWVSALEDALTGPAAHDLLPGVREASKSLTEKHKEGTWQFKAVESLSDALNGFYGAESSQLGSKVSLLDWFKVFATLRNKTRGHGAPTPPKCHEWVGPLKSSIEAVCKNSPLKLHSWAYLHRNLSGRYHVANICGDGKPFEPLKTSEGQKRSNLPNGVYVWIDGFRKVDLCRTDSNVNDFFFPNGAFGSQTFELHSTISDDRAAGDAKPYLLPAKERPSSETEGLGKLEVVGNVFTNVPLTAAYYVERPKLEGELKKILLNDRHPIVTLVGRGGIGKTSLAIHILKEIVSLDRYDVIIWFSSRDIDLTAAGPKAVKAQVRTDKEMAKQFVRLVGAEELVKERKVQAKEFLSEEFHTSSYGPALFVFDNFETAESPVDLFNWIDSNIRSPNKALITSRFRDFKADYPIDVHGMEMDEALELVRQTSVKLAISGMVSDEQAREVVEAASFHPYVIKILLGEIADSGKYHRPKQIMAKQDEILDALFERTFNNLTPLAERIFLTLCGWKSLVPQLGVEAMIHRYRDPDLDPETSIDQLVRMSLVERKIAPDNSVFLEVPLSAAIFGNKKLEYSPQAALIETDLRFLKDFGPTAATGISSGLDPKIRTFFKNTAQKVEKGEENANEIKDVLEFLASSYSEAWMLLADLETERRAPQHKKKAVEYIRRYLETDPPAEGALDAWLRLEEFYSASGNNVEACMALLKADRIGEQPYYRLSRMANRLNRDSQLRQKLNKSHIETTYKPLSILMEARLPEAKATDHSRLAWLHLHCGNNARALEIAEQGLKKDSSDTHCLKIVKRLKN